MFKQIKKKKKWTIKKRTQTPVTIETLNTSKIKHPLGTSKMGSKNLEW